MTTNLLCARSSAASSVTASNNNDNNNNMSVVMLTTPFAGEAITIAWWPKLRLLPATHAPQRVLYCGDVAQWCMQLDDVYRGDGNFLLPYRSPPPGGIPCVAWIPQMEGFLPEFPEAAVRPPHSWRNFRRMLINNPRCAEKVGLYRFRQRMERYCELVKEPGQELYHDFLTHSPCRVKPEVTS